MAIMSAQRVILFFLAALATIATDLCAGATDFPTRRITMIVPFSAGGPTDVIARIIADPMARTLGQPIRIENIPGGGGTKGTARAKYAEHDGYTLIMGHMGTHAAAVSLYQHLGYAIEREEPYKEGFTVYFAKAVGKP